MKRKLKKINIKSLIIAILCVVLIVVILLKFVIFNNSTNKYGNRLDSIKNIKFSEKNIKTVTSFLKENDKVSKTSINVKGKIINIIITVSDDVSKDDARKIASSSLEKISDKVKSSYDIQVFVNKKNNGDNNEFPMIGYKNIKNNDFVW